MYILLELNEEKLSKNFLYKSQIRIFYEPRTKNDEDFFFYIYVPRSYIVMRNMPEGLFFLGFIYGEKVFAFLFRMK